MKIDFKRVWMLLDPQRNLKFENASKSAVGASLVQEITGKTYLLIVQCTDTYWCLEVHEKKGETITTLLDVWFNVLVWSYMNSHFLLTGEGNLRNALPI